MQESSQSLATVGNHNITAFSGAPLAHTRRELLNALLGPTPLPRTTPAGWVDHSLRYDKRDPIGDILSIIRGRLQHRAGPANVLAFPEMLRSHVMALGAEMRPLDLVCQRELSMAEQDAGCSLDKLQFAMQAAPNVGLCLEFLKLSAEYRGRLDALEVFCWHFIKSQS